MAANIIEELKNALDRYETDNCKTEIVSFSIINGGNVLNEHEQFRFKVKVTNQSHLDMKNVKVQAVGTPYADVVSSPSQTVNIDAHQQFTTNYFTGKAKGVTPGGKPADIVKARIVSWDASFDHILKDHTSADPTYEGRLNKAVIKD